MQASLVKDPQAMAWWCRRPPSGLIFHSVDTANSNGSLDGVEAFMCKVPWIERVMVAHLRPLGGFAMLCTQAFTGCCILCRPVTVRACPTGDPIHPKNGSWMRPPVP
jgi:hypothetical protein